MSFVHPWFLLALSAVAIPVIIHLFHFRRFKKVYFSNINFLQRLSDETQKQARLKHLLVLLSRILAIIFLVMAFARPFIPVDEASEQWKGNTLSIFVDNSFSMEAGTTAGNLLDQAKQHAAEIAEMFDPTDQFQLLTNDFEAKHQRFVSRDEFLRMLSEVTFSPSIRSVSEVMQRQSDFLAQEAVDRNKMAFLLSDFQKNITDLHDLPSGMLADFFFIPFQMAVPANVFVDSVWIENPVRLPQQVISVEVRIYNDSDERLENQPVRLYINDVQRSVATYDVGPNTHTDITLNYTLGDTPFQSGFVEITDHPITFDDRFYFSFALSDNIPVMAINAGPSNRFLDALLGRDTTFVYQNVQAGAIDYSLFSSQNLIILNGSHTIGSGLAAELRRYVTDGGNLLVFPPENENFSSYNDFLTSMQVAGFNAVDTQSTRVTALNELHPVYRDVFESLPDNMDMPVADKYFVIDRQTRGREQYLMQLQNGNYFFTETPAGQGRVFLSAVPASDTFSNFQRHALFVPTIYNIALHSGAFYPIAYTIGIDEFITVRNYQPGAGTLFTISSEQLEVIPEARTLNNNVNLLLHNQIQDHGNYDLKAGEELLRILSFNYDRRESLLESYDKSQLENLIDDNQLSNISVFETGNISFERQMELFRGGRQLWKLFLLLAGVFLLTEVLLLRFWR